MKFKDTKVGQFLSANGVKTLSVVGDVLPSNGVLGIIKNVISSATELNAQQKAQANLLLEEEMDYYKMDVEDTGDARKMQIAALGQSDVFSKRFIMYLTMTVIAFTLVLIAGLYFIDIPKENQSLIYMALGVVIGGYTSVISFWFGTSHSSANKQEVLYSALTNKI